MCSQVCYHCLAVLSGATVLCNGQYRFCSAGCLSSAQASYLKVSISFASSCFHSLSSSVAAVGSSWMTVEPDRAPDKVVVILKV